MSVKPRLRTDPPLCVATKNGILLLFQGGGRSKECTHTHTHTYTIIDNSSIRGVYRHKYHCSRSLHEWKATKFDVDVFNSMKHRGCRCIESPELYWCMKGWETHTKFSQDTRRFYRQSFPLRGVSACATEYKGS